MNRIWEFLRSLDWRVLFAVPVLAVLLGVANNLRVSEDQRVRWSGERLEEGGKEFNVTRERIRQIEAKALRKLRHPSRSKKLRDFLN